LVFAFPGLGYSASLGTALALLLRFQDVLVSALGLAAGGWRFYRKDIQSELQSEMELPATPEESSARTDSDQHRDYDNHLIGVKGRAWLRQIYYDLIASIYDQVLSLSSGWDGVDETRERQLLTEQLQLSSNDRVLEVAVGTGSNIPHLAQNPTADLNIIGIDYSHGMLVQCRQKLQSEPVTAGLVQSDASRLPFPSDYFNAVLHFGGFNNFHQPKRALEEMMRVARSGARIVISDLSLANITAPSLHQKILIKLKLQSDLPPPIYMLPSSYLDNVRLFRFWGGAAYIIRLVKPG
jgi:ubiquinone/menaquinone biosynthesis C-methylase UbiE